MVSILAGFQVNRDDILMEWRRGVELIHLGFGFISILKVKERSDQGSVGFNGLSMVFPCSRQAPLVA